MGLTMFNKKMRLFLITLVFILSLSAVAAADTNSSDDALAGDIEEPPSGNSNLLSVDGDTVTTTQDDQYVMSTGDVETYYSGSNYSVVLSQNSTPVKNVSISLSVNGVTYTQNTDDDGKVSIPLNLNAGSYVISTTFGDINNTEKIDILPVVKGSDLTKTYKNTKQYSATFLNSDGTPLENTNVKFKVNGKTYTKKTNSKGVASLAIDLPVGTYTIYAIHPDGYKISNKIVIKTSVVASNLQKRYLSSKVFSATFYGKNGKVLANKYVTFKAHGSTFKVKTNSKGVAKLSIISKPTSFKVYSINPQTGEQKSNTVKILPTMTASAMTVFSDKTSKFKVVLYKNEKLVKNAKVYVYIKGVKKTATTDANGVASVSFKLAKGTYTFKSYDPYTKYSINTKITVKLASIKASNDYAAANRTSVYTATLLKQNGDVAKNTKMQMTLNGVTYTVKTNAYGAATINYKIDKEGTYNVVCTDLSTGYQLTRTITVFESNIGKTYTQYGVSEDGYSLLAIGRASAPGELSKYGYTFYVTEFDRTCSFCGGHNLYWSIFFAGSEYGNWGTFPATGNGEGGSAEGIIVCADCDTDWSIFGHNHGGPGGDLTVITPTQSCSKEDAYTLKNGSYVAS